ncbi:long-chain-fatty-acid--CoA ligase [Aeromicrobium sp. PE09-221]|uniref:long-chain-fatty-acid--CoA ligase n=1 Tax=Aeromicrobium sp. PE09-221 TaxID=1898043 RepID=UPI000B3E47DD|nr:long-chain fatty acid--CoA ligase [Aeromicrobium sp. PE09-221]OUZ09279.1 long-chain-fatty-acid--CoA ligase [Aeromicrobium sp. PE09-221]
MANLSRILEESAKKYPERTAIVFGDTRLSYAQVDGAASQVANLLVSRGIEPGDKVAISIPNLPYFTIVYFGILKAGATVVPLNILLTAREVAYHLDDSDAKAYFAFEGAPGVPIGDNAWEGFQQVEGVEDFFLIKLDSAAPAPLEGPEYYAPLVAEQSPVFETVERDDDDTAVILYTSGTTGQPKGAELRHRNLYDNAALGEALFEADENNPDIYLAVLPLFHIFGQSVIQNGCLLYGGTMVMLPRFDAASAIKLLLSEKVTFFAGVPTMYWGLLGALDETVDVAEIARNLRVAAAGGAALPGDIHRQFAEKFGVTILEGYGLSETSPVASFSPWGEPPVVGSIGKPVPGVEMKLIDNDWNEIPDDPEAIGEIAIKGHGIMKGYYKRPAATEEAIRGEWFRSGDLARRDENGYYFIVDRSKDMIIRGGYNVYPRELEEVLMTHPAVSLVAVIGVPHESHGEEIKAVVVREPGAEITEDELIAWGKEQFAAYKYPRIVEFRDELPMTSTGKILKRELS